MLFIIAGFLQRRQSRWKNQKLSDALLFLAIIASLAIGGTACRAANSESQDAGNFEKPPSIADTNASRASRELSRQASKALKNGELDKAISLASAAASKDFENDDAHRICAEALEGQILKDSVGNPLGAAAANLNQTSRCLAEWLTFMRAKTNEDGRIHLDGVGMSNFWPEHDRRFMIGQQHLLNLTGLKPHAWETNRHFIQRARKKLTSK